MKKNKKKVFNEAIKYLVKRRGCCDSICDTITDDFDIAECLDYFHDIFYKDAKEYWGKAYGYFFEGTTIEDRSKIDEAYTSRVIALQLTQILWDEGQTF